MTKPLFRIEQLISALLKGSPDDPVYLKVGPTTYGIKSITDGSIRVTTGSETQDAAQVVKTLRRYATGTPKGEDTGIAWRIVGVGGGTAIKSVSHDGSRIVVTTLANEGKSAEDVYVHGDDGVARSIRVNKTHARNMSNLSEGATTTVKDQRKGTLHTVKRVGKGFEHAAEESEIALVRDEMGGCHHCGKKGHDSKGLCVSCNKPWFGPRTKDIFEAPRSERKTTPGKRAHNSAVSSKISQIMKDYDKTGRIGSSKPKNRAAAIKQAVAVAYSMVNKDYSKKGKRLPRGVRRAEDGEESAWSELMVIYGDYADSMEGVKGAGIYQRAWYVPDPDDEDGCFVCQGFTDPMCMVVYALTDDADAVMDGKAKPSEEGEYYLCDLHAPEPFKDSMNAENQDMMCCGDYMEFHEDYFYCPVCEKSIETDEFKAFGAPMGYAPDGPRPFYGNPRKLVRDRWGNLRFIRRRKDGTYMDNVDFGRSIRADRQRQAKTWAPGGFRDQGDGSLDLLTSLMGAESGDTVYMIDEEMHDTGGELRYYQTGPYATEAGAQAALKNMMEKSCDEWSQHSRLAGEGITFDLVLTDDGFLEIKPSNGSLDDFMATYTMTGRKSDREFSGMLYRAKVVPKQIMAAEDDVFEASRRSGSDAGEGICGGCGKNSEHRMNFGRRKMCYDCAMERYDAESNDTGKWFIIPMQELLWEGAEGNYWNAGTPCSMDPDDFMDDYAEEIYDLDEVFFNVPWPQVYNPGDPVVNVDTGEAFMLDKREEDYGSPIIAILIRVKDQEMIDQFIMEGNRAFDRPPTFELDSDETISDWDLVVIDGQRHKILVGPWDNDDPDYEKQEMERESVRKEVFARGGLGPGGYRHPVVWLVESWMDGVSDGARLFSKESDARAVFEGYIRDLRGDPADASDGDWVADEGFQRVRMYQVMIE